MKKMTLFLVMASLSVACFAFGAKGHKKGGDGSYGRQNCAPGQMCEQRFGKGQRFDGNFRMFQNLDLTDAQKEKIQAIHKKNRDQIFELRTEIQKAKIDQRVCLKDNDFSKAKKYASDISKAESKIEQKRIDMMEDCYNVLTKEQKSKL